MTLRCRDFSVLDPDLVQGTLPAALGNLTAVSEVILQQQNFTGALSSSFKFKFMRSTP